MIKRFVPFFQTFLEMTLSLLTRRGQLLLISVPYFWLLCFLFAPFLMILFVSLSDIIMAAPPFRPLYVWTSEHTVEIYLNLHTYYRLITDSIYLEAFLNSLKIASLATFFSLLIGYPMAYAITKVSQAWRIPLLMMVMLPFWTSFLIRVYAWIGMLSKEGVLNYVLMNLGIIKEPLKLLHTDGAVCLGIVYSYLPFMILPLYVSISKIDAHLLEAASDLGCRPFKSFLKVILPLTRSGIVAGGLLIFIPAVGEFVIPELLGSADTLMIGRIIWSEFFINRDWPTASALAVLLILILVLPFMLFQKLRDFINR